MKKSKPSVSAELTLFCIKMLIMTTDIYIFYQNLP